MSRKLPPHQSLGSGLLMGAADAVPGVSGGTIALIVGVYDTFISSLSTMIASPKLIAKPEGRAKLLEALKFLVPLGIGIAISYFLVTKLLVGPKENPGIFLEPDTAHYCYAFFFGLVLFSIPEPIKRIEKLAPIHVVPFLIAAALAAWFVGLPYVQAEPAKWMLLFGGAGAIAVMLLPGVSGSLLLVILGQYTAVTGAVHDRDFGTLGIFLLGIALGAALFIPCLKMLLKNFNSMTMAALAGLMAGSLRALWPYKTNYNPKVGEVVNTSETRDLLLVIVAFLSALIVVFALKMFERAILRNQETLDD